MTSVPTNIIVEGPDCAGKTTLIENLKNYIPPPVGYVHHGPYKDESDIAHHYIESLSFNRGMTTLIDRCWISEQIYSQFYGRSNRLSDENIAELEDMAHKVHTVIIFCLPPINVCFTKFLERKHEEYLENTEQFINVYSAYQKLHTLTTLTSFTYDYTKKYALLDLVTKLTAQNFIYHIGDLINVDTTHCNKKR